MKFLKNKWEHNCAFLWLFKPNRGILNYLRLVSILSRKTKAAKTHCSIHQPFLEVVLARLRFLQVPTTLCSYPIHQSLLQVWVILLLNFLLHLSAQSITGPSVCHCGSPSNLVFIFYAVFNALNGTNDIYHYISVIILFLLILINFLIYIKEFLVNILVYLGYFSLSGTRLNL